jgi:hypothetical protein
MNASSRVFAPRLAINAAGASLTRTRPACMSEMRSQRSASFMKCVETKIVTPSRRESSPRIRQKPSRATGSTPEVGSSRIRSSGPWIIATASWRRCRWPSGRESGRVSMMSTSSRWCMTLPSGWRRSSAVLGAEPLETWWRQLAVKMSADGSPTHSGDSEAIEESTACKVDPIGKNSNRRADSARVLLSAGESAVCVPTDLPRRAKASASWVIANLNLLCPWGLREDRHEGP